MNNAYAAFGKTILDIATNVQRWNSCGNNETIVTVLKFEYLHHRNFDKFFPQELPKFKFQNSPRLRRNSTLKQNR